MASQKRRERSFRVRYEQVQTRIEQRSQQVRRRSRSEKARMAKLGPLPRPEDPTSPWAQRRDLIFDYLRNPANNDVTSFYIVAVPGSSAFPAEEIERYAHVFDEFVGTAWRVTVEYGLGDNGEPGWVFER